MLVLTRKIGEKIMIGDDIEITLTRFERNAVRLAIQAPAHIKIYRGELYREIHGIEPTKPASQPPLPPSLPDS